MMASDTTKKLCVGLSGCFRKLAYSHAKSRGLPDVQGTHLAANFAKRVSGSQSWNKEVAGSLLSYAASSTSQVKFISMPSGKSINPDDYNPSSDQAASMNLATFFDSVPMISSTWTSNGSSISTHWQTLLTTSKSIGGDDHHDHGDPILLEKYEEARKRLYTDYDTLERAPFYKSLDTLLEKITQKHLEFFNVKDQILQILGPSFTQEEYDELYMKLSPPYLKDIEIMQKEFSFRAKEVQNYLADIYAYTTANNTVESVLMDMNAKMDTYKRVANGKMFYEVVVNPSNWWTWFEPDYDSNDGWIKQTCEPHKTTYEDNGMAAIVPFFQFETGERKRFNMALPADDCEMSVSFNGQIIEIVRPWLDTSLLAYNNITLAGAEEAQWSTGVMDKSNKGTFPLLPTNFVAVKDVTITGNKFSNQMKDTFDKFVSLQKEKKIQSWNLLYFGGDGNKEVSWNRDKVTLTISGVSIIGAICTLIPYFPIKADSN